MKVVNINVPILHAGQLEMTRNAKRYNVGAMGRRFGKTKFCLHRLLCGERSILDGYPAGWFAPSSRYIDEVWAEICYRCKGIISNTNKSSGRISFVTGASLDFWPMGENPQVARGRRYSRVIIDEAAHIRYLKDAWERAVSPTLTDYQGEAWFISTPNGLNFFHDLHRRGDDPEFNDWQNFQLPTTTNPHIAKEEVESRRKELPELVFRQEYLAEFITFGAGLVKPEYLLDAPTPPHIKVVLAVDLAISEKQGADWTAIVAMGLDADTGIIYVKEVERFRGAFNEVLNRIKSSAERHKPTLIAIEQTQFQAAVVQELSRTTNYPVRGIRPDKDKLTRFMPILTRYEQHLVRHDPSGVPSWFRDELLAFPTGQHDDGVDALAYCFNSLQNASLIEYNPMPNKNDPDYDYELDDRGAW